MDDAAFFRKVGSQLGCDPLRTKEVIFAIFQELRDRLTPKEGRLKRLWLEAGEAEVAR